MTDMNITIITGPTGTGKGYVAQALSKLDPKTLVFEVNSLAEVADVFANKIKDKDSIPTFVCTDTFTFTPLDLFLFNGTKINNAYLIHLSHCLTP